jgi:hypothetical protein
LFAYIRAEPSWVDIRAHGSKECVGLLSCPDHDAVLARFVDGTEPFGALVSRGKNNERFCVD